MMYVEQDQEIIIEQDEQDTSSWGYILYSVLVIAWVTAGIFAFVMSLLCFGSSGSDVQKIFGFLLAVFTGPIYFILFYANKSYRRAYKIKK